MCGITGILDLQGDRNIDPGLIRRMRDSIAHRGPDEAGVFEAPGIALGHRRLSIIDIKTGQQPLSTPDGKVTIVFNGEIDNFQELADDLKGKGHRFATHSDTETIVHAWIEWGEDCVHHLRGMFAFAIWDAPQKTLFLARDRMGIKPLLYAFTNDGHLVFGSEQDQGNRVAGVNALGNQFGVFHSALEAGQ